MPGTLYGYEIDSPLPLRRLREGTKRRGVITVRLATEPLLDEPAELTALMTWEDGRASVVVGRADGRVLVWCSTSGAHELDAAAGLIRTAPAGSEAAWEHRFGVSHLLVLLAERGELALHAACAEIEGRAYLFCGVPGQGKSTLAFNLSRLGYPILSEDGVAVELGSGPPLAWPGLRGVRLGTAPGEDFWSTRPLPCESDLPAPVGAVIALAPRGGERLEAERLPPAEAAAALAPNLVHVGGAGGIRPAFARLAELLRRAPGWRVRLPDDLDRAPAAAAQLAERLAADVK